MRASTAWRVLIVDDDECIGNSVKEFLEDEQLNEVGDTADVSVQQDFDAAFGALESTRYDIAILDVRRQGGRHSIPEEEAGEQLLRKIQGIRFLPVIFYTGLSNLVTHIENSPFVQVVSKGSTHEALLNAVQITLKSQLAHLNRALLNHMDNVQRDYMWGFVSKYWQTIIGQTDKTAVSYLLARRLASSLSDPTAAGLASELGSEFCGEIAAGKIHPMQSYVLPPLDNPSMVSGDIYKGQIYGEGNYWVMLTPSCDLVQNKAERLLLAGCALLQEQEEYLDWRKSPSKGKRQLLAGLLQNNRKVGQQGRYVYLPGAIHIPNLVVDLQNILAIERPEFDSMGLNRLATLDSPFAEALTSQFSRLYGRIGTPDLDTDWVIAQLEENS